MSSTYSLATVATATVAIGGEDFTVATARAADAKSAAAIVADYRAAGNGSNRTDWVRMVAILAAVLTVRATGKSVDVTALFPNATHKAYHVAHRALSAGAIRPYWNDVQVVALKNVVRGKNEITGESDTVRGTTVLICPVA